MGYLFVGEVMVAYLLVGHEVERLVLDNGEEESLKVEAWAAESEKNRKLSARVYIGIIFNIRAREAERRVMTTLFEGSVNMYRNADDQVGRRLKPGQTMMVDTECGAAPVVLPHPFFVLQLFGFMPI